MRRSALYSTSGCKIVTGTTAASGRPHVIPGPNGKQISLILGSDRLGASHYLPPQMAQNESGQPALPASGEGPVVAGHGGVIAGSAFERPAPAAMTLAPQE
jgi:hypothetical protein